LLIIAHFAAPGKPQNLAYLQEVNMKLNGLHKWMVEIALILWALSGCTPAVIPPAPAEIRVSQQMGAPAASSLSRRQVLEKLFDAAYLDQDVYGRNDTILVHWPDTLGMAGQLTIRIQTSSGRIYLEGSIVAQPSAVADLGKAYLLPPGDYEVALMPMPGEYYMENMRIERKMSIRVQQ
jgi:hypothetical protein